MGTGQGIEEDFPTLIWSLSHTFIAGVRSRKDIHRNGVHVSPHTSRKSLMCGLDPERFFAVRSPSQSKCIYIHLPRRWKSEPPSD